MEIEKKEQVRQFGQRLRELRVKKGVNMQYVSDRIGVARSTYAGYETQNRFPQIDILAKLAEVLNTSTDYLIGVTDVPEAKEITRNVDEYLSSVGQLNWNGIPLSNDDLKPLRDLFNIVLRERLANITDDNAKKDCDGK